MEQQTLEQDGLEKLKENDTLITEIKASFVFESDSVKKMEKRRYCWQKKILSTLSSGSLVLTKTGSGLCVFSE